MKTEYIVLKPIKALGVEIEPGYKLKYEMDEFTKLLLDNGFIKEVKEDKVEGLIKKIIKDDSTSCLRTVLLNHIKDNGKEEVLDLFYQFSIAQKQIVRRELDKYIIIKI